MPVDNENPSKEECPECGHAVSRHHVYDDELGYEAWCEVEKCNCGNNTRK